MVKSRMSDVELFEVPLHQMSLQAMETFGDKVALIDGVTETQYTYSQTIDAIKRVASGLARAGVKKGDVMALLSPNSPEFVFMFYASLACGATVTPINPVYTVYEVHKQLEDSKASFIFAVRNTIKTAINAGKKTGRQMTSIVPGGFPYAMSFETLLNDDGSCYPDVSVDVREHLAVIPYSSGTTGVPKGVMLTHFNIVSQLLQVSHPDFAVPGREVEENPVVIAYLPFFHVYGMHAVMTGGLLRGATLVIMPRFQEVRFLELIQKYKVTRIPAVPPVVLFLAKSPLVKNYDISSVKSLGSGGAPLSKELEAEVLEKHGTILEVSQGFGMTETTLCVTTVAGFRPLRPGSVGVIIPNCEIQIMDPDTKAILGPNQRGELWVRGPNMMKGYLNRPEATRETIDSQGWLRTGDIAYYDEDGWVYMVDRIKELIKYKGFQVPPAELEALLLTHPGIDDVAVIGVPDKEAGELPRAYVVRKPAFGLTEEQVKQYVQEHLSSFKYLRGGVEFLETIPKSQSGKILRRQLKDRLTQSKM